MLGNCRLLDGSRLPLVKQSGDWKELIVGKCMLTRRARGHPVLIGRLNLDSRQERLRLITAITRRMDAILSQKQNMDNSCYLAAHPVWHQFQIILKSWLMSNACHFELVPDRDNQSRPFSFWSLKLNDQSRPFSFIYNFGQGMPYIICQIAVTTSSPPCGGTLYTKVSAWLLPLGSSS